ncbi:dynein regulatory complex subunit 7 [Scomber scombrus]|uniref:dynein regulatory complex subunit 7 n=1 Tax=Scomber scombrus TaxID=13677 RepID=UPI002DDBDE66|nr:dynein regulatory complex subunit 7 [Scomber scombrus]
MSPLPWRRSSCFVVETVRLLTRIRQMESHDEEQCNRAEEEIIIISDLHVSAPQDLLRSLEKTDESLPESYRVNSSDETRLLDVALNFQRQYSHLFPERKALLLCPANECGVKKFVSTTLQPTLSIHPELFTWDGCASFVANFLSLEPLEPPVELPRYLFSSTSVLQSQRATCFEFSSLLCSLLLGANYDAYCVSGYAVREMCLLDQSLQDCPLLDTQAKVVTSEQEQQDNKYTVKPLRQLKSHFVMQQEKKKQEAEAVLLHRQTLQESGPPPADPLWGLRVHCWVLVLAGSRSVQENFFIDPLTGKSYDTANSNFLGIESVWNDLNYYVNMQDCRNGCTDMLFDLDDVNLWEPVLFGATSRKQLIVDVMKKKESRLLSRMNNDDEEEQQPRAFEMPRSWISPICISKKDVERRWPAGQRTSHYSRAKLEEFSPYLRSDGLLTRLTCYTHLDSVVSVKEWYRHRNDHLEEREVNHVDNFTVERFTRGRRFHLLFHRYAHLSAADTERQMEFSSVRVDGLVRRVEAPGEMTETFEGRDDFLFFRRSVFHPHVQFTDDDVTLKPEEQPPTKVVERFHRNRKRPAGEDVAERVFLLAQRRVEVTYHLEDHRFIPSKRSFIKPRESTEEQKEEQFTADMVSSFQVDPAEQPVQTLALYDMLVVLMEDEKKVLLQIKESQKEVRDIVACRQQEETNIQLLFSPWTTTGAAKAHSQRLEMERVAAEEQRWLQEKEQDLLAPLMMSLDNTETLSPSDAQQLYQNCLQDFKLRLVEQANLIQERYEQETEELQEKQLWYQKNQLNMNQNQKQEYQNYCCKKTLQIHTAKKRLSIHRDSAPQKLRALDQRLKRDARLAPHLLS